MLLPMRWLLVFALSVTAFTQIPPDTAGSHLNAGVKAYKRTQYEIAIAEFKRAAELDPDLFLAHIYLATVYANSYVPGLDTPQNDQYAELAIDNFKQVIAAAPPKQTKINCLKAIASLYFNQASALMNKNFKAAATKLNEAKEYQQKIIAEQPDDAVARYSIGVIDWTLAYQPRMAMRKRLGLDNIQPLDSGSCADLRGSNQDVVNDGIAELTQALKYRPDYDDAMAYMNLMYREKADIECGDPQARAADIKQADQWVQRTMDIKNAKLPPQSPQH